MNIFALIFWAEKEFCLKTIDKEIVLFFGAFFNTQRNMTKTTTMTTADQNIDEHFTITNTQIGNKRIPQLNLRTKSAL